MNRALSGLDRWPVHFRDARGREDPNVTVATAVQLCDQVMRHVFSARYQLA
jgi:hypothetical protein